MSNKLKVLHFSANGPVGGAGRAAYAIHTGLLDQDCDSRMVVHASPVPEMDVLPAAGTSISDKLRTSIAFRRRSSLINSLGTNAIYHPDRLSTLDLRHLDVPFSPDVIHLHWVAGLLSSRQIYHLWKKYRCPIVWTVVDMSPLTGGCHYSHDCTGYSRLCGDCPVLTKRGADDESHRSMVNKSHWLEGLPITIAGGTQWVLDRAAKSSLFRNTPAVKIPYGKNLGTYHPGVRRSVREALQIPTHAQIIFFGTERHNEPRKGMKYLHEAMPLLKESMYEAEPPIVLLTAGVADKKRLESLPFPVFELGMVEDDRLLAMAYQAADVFVCPSVEDAGPLMMVESLLCGTPVVAFAECGGAPDYIRTGRNGHLVETRSAEALAKGIKDTLVQSTRGEITQDICSTLTVSDCSIAGQASSYVNLYRELLGVVAEDDNRERERYHAAGFNPL